MTHSFQALGTTWWITLFADTNAADAIFDDIGRFAVQYETRYSRFQPDSLISQLNRERTLKLSDPELHDLLTYGKQLYLRTNGRFNILTGHILEARGYDAAYSFQAENDTELTPGNPITDLQISAEAIELSYGNVDLGGFGKGYLIDRIAERLKDQHQVEHFLVNGGGDMYATRSSEGPISIYLEHPEHTGQHLAETTLMDQGFAASSSHKRRWPGANETEHTHIVGEHSYDATFIKAKTAADADAFATTFLLCPPAEQEQLAQQENLGVARFYTSEGRLFANELFVAS